MPLAKPFPSESAIGRHLVAALILGLLFAVLGPFKAVAAAVGLVLILAILEWPIIGLVAVVLSGTCFKIIGSETIASKTER